MNQQERQKLQNEWSEITERLRKDFPKPKDARRRDEIASLLMTDGLSADVKLKFAKARETSRVTSFSRNRR